VAQDGPPPGNDSAGAYSSTPRPTHDPLLDGCRTGPPTAS